MRQVLFRRVLLFVFIALFVLRTGSVRADDLPYDVVIAGEGPVGLFAAVKLKREVPSARVVIFEKRGEERAGRPNTPTYSPEALSELSRVGVGADKFTSLHERVFTKADGTIERVTVDPTARAEYKPFEQTVLLEKNHAATQGIGKTEESLRDIATKLGVEFHYDAEVTNASDGESGVTLTFADKDGPHTIRSKFSMLADGARGLGAKMAGTTAVGSVPMMAVVSSVPGKGTFEKFQFPDASAPDGYLTIIKIGSESGISVLAETPPAIDAMPKEQQQAWFHGMAKRVGVDPSTFIKDKEGKPIPVASFPANLSRGRSGEGHLFYIGDAAGTVPIITGSGVNKGILQVVDDVPVVAKLLKDPTANAHASTILATHHAREDKAQGELFNGFKERIGTHLRPVPAARPAAPKMGEAKPSLTVHQQTTTHAPEPHVPAPATQAVHLEQAPRVEPPTSVPPKMPLRPQAPSTQPAPAMHH
jgi:2-polyprenyl-6-methoxyphenol hydroxylase-like FAD-dependent oxidoreductase